MRLFTIGFTQKSAERFFTMLGESGAKRLVDVRLNNVSQLAGFTKRDDLEYFLRAICKMDYVHLPELAPTAEMLDRYKKQKGIWPVFEREFVLLLMRRGVERSVSSDLLADGCLLCGEAEPQQCHRRLVAEYLKLHWGDVEIVHLS